MSPAQLQLALALVERQAKQLHEAYMDQSARCHELFEELQQVNNLVDSMRVEAEQAGKAVA